MKRIAISLALSLAATIAFAGCLDDERTDEPTEEPGKPVRPETDRADIEETFEIGTPDPTVPKGFGNDGRIELRFPDENGECCIVLRYAPEELHVGGRQ
jgi:hypothetical protein